MNEKLTPKQTRFCQLYIETGSASEAYREAYNSRNMKPTTINRKAKELLDNGKITARVKKLQEEHRKRHDVTVDSLTKELIESRELAKELENPTAMTTATMAKAKLHGLITNRQDLTSEGKSLNIPIDLTPITFVRPAHVKDE